MSDALASERESAIRFAETLEREGNTEGAAKVWWNLCAKDPYDRQPREKFADLMFADNEPLMPRSGLERTRTILRMMGMAFPTPKLASAYFESLNDLLQPMPKLEQPGTVVLGIGSGRCGSTTLAYAMARTPHVCGTHENPPMLYWEPLEEQLGFHIERFRILSQYFSVVFDAAYWWLNSRERIFDEFPDAKVIALCRETPSCVESFMARKGSGKGSLNHWAPRGNTIWATSPGDPSLPSYEIADSLLADPDAAKRAMLTRYVTEYNEALDRLAVADPQRVIVVHTEDLNDAKTYGRISDFLGIEVQMPDAALNVGASKDSARPNTTF